MAGKSSQSLGMLISAAGILSGLESKTSQSPDIATVLRSRLARVYEALNADDRTSIEGVDLKTLQYITAKESLDLIESIQSLLDPEDSDLTGSEPSPPLLGTRDLSHIRTLLSIVFKWAIQPLVTELELIHLGSKIPASGEPRIIDLTERALDFEDLPVLTLRLLALSFGLGLSGKIRQTWITTSILSQHAVDMLTPCLIVGWATKPITDSFARSFKDIRALSVRFINLLRPHEAISALGAILSSTSNKQGSFQHVPKACGYLLSNQLKRPDGIQGLCITVFGEEAEEVDAAPIDKLEHIAKVLRTVPATSKPEEYYGFMVPRILALLVPSSTPQTPPSHKRAAAFTLSRMISPTFQHHTIVSSILLPLIHDPFFPPSKITEDNQATTMTQTIPHLTAAASLQTLQTFLLHTDPSPTELSTLLTPIVPELYTLVSLHRTNKIADPNVRESLNALLNTWGRIVSSPDAIDGLWKIVSGSGGTWELRMDGFTRTTESVPPPSISLLAVAELQSRSKDDVDISANPFNLRPDPSEFVALLKSLDRKDVSSEVFIRLLSDYRELKESETQPLRTLLYLQLILQIQDQLSETVLSKPEHVLSFIKHALDSEQLSLSNVVTKTTQKKGLRLEDLRIVEDVGDSDDSDDEDEGDGLDEEEPGGGKQEMVVTAITLLLSVLEANPALTPRDVPDLEAILTSLEHLTSHASPAIRPLAREARLVLTARTASTSSASSARPATTESESAQTTYQKALRLLQDPIIPVRAHGLQLLRELVSRSFAPKPKASQTRSDKPLLDPALIPGILSIFLQSIQDDESFIFLNAVQGLAAMVNGYGKEVLRGIIDVYLNGTGIGGSGGTDAGVVMMKEELDARLRVGEALNAVVKRCGGALGLYVDMLVPPLLIILRSSHLPTTLRSSALSLLAQCMATNAIALSAYTTSLTDTCIEVIQLESVAAKSVPKSKGHRSPQSAVVDDSANEGDRGAVKHSGRQPDLMDTDPTTKTTKAAPLRRSALHFLSQLLHSHIGNLYDRRSAASLPPVTLKVEGSRISSLREREWLIPDSVLKRANVVLGYVAVTDEDAVTRVMAGEASELVEQYKGAALGF